MTTPAIRVAAVCIAIAVLLLNKPLGRMTAAWQKMIGLGSAVAETTNRVVYVAGAVLALILALWGS